MSVPLEAFKPVPKPRRSYVYIVVDHAAGRFKVGHAVRPRSRFLRMLRDRPNGDMHLVAAGFVPAAHGSTKVAESIETSIQARLVKHKRGHGDWFLMDALHDAVDLLAAGTILVPPAALVTEALQPFGAAGVEDLERPS